MQDIFQHTQVDGFTRDPWAVSATATVSVDGGVSTITRDKEPQTADGMRDEYAYAEVFDATNLLCLSSHHIGLVIWTQNTNG